METQTPPSFPEEALQHVLSLMESRADRSSVSLVCKSWYDIERCCRRHVFIGNCYAVSPPILIRRFSDVRSITIKGKQSAADYDLVPDGWGAHALPWIQALAVTYPAMEEIRMKRMVVTDQGLELIATHHNNLRVLVLYKCEGFSTDGLASIAANCRNLKTLDLSKCEIEDLSGKWISHFPNSYTSLEFLNIEALQKFELSYLELEQLIGRCCNLKGLRLSNSSYPLENLQNLLLKTPQLVDLGIASFTMGPCHETFTKLTSAFKGLRGRLKNLSGLVNVSPYYLPTLYHVCSALTSLDLSRSTLRSHHLVKLIHHCPDLTCLLVLDYIEDCGLEEVAASCKKLQELRVLPSNPFDVDPSINITEQGLVSVVVGCPRLHRILYVCSRMTNVALLKIAKHLPNLTFLRLCILEPQVPDYLTHEPLDNGFISILQGCKRLKRLWPTGLVTDRLLEHIGIFGNKLEVLALTFCRGSNRGLDHVFSGCRNLKKLIIVGCPFDGQAILANSDRLHKMRFLSMLSCPLTYEACKVLGKKHPRLNVEVIIERGSLHSLSDECIVEDLYVYRTVAGPRVVMGSCLANKGSTLSPASPRPWRSPWFNRKWYPLYKTMISNSLYDKYRSFPINVAIVSSLPAEHTLRFLTSSSIMHTLSLVLTPPVPTPVLSANSRLQFLKTVPLAPVPTSCKNAYLISYIYYYFLF